MRFYCTLFDKNYLPNFLALYDSIIKFNPDICFYAFCMDDYSYEYLTHSNDSSQLKIISSKELVRFFPQLDEIKKTRSLVEYYFTCSSFICKYVFENSKNCSHVTYLDADLYFFNNPELVFIEIANSSIAIIPHKFYGYGKRFEKYGIYNVGWVTFKNNIIGRECLESWVSNCAEWCFDFYDKVGDRFGDQKYLDNWVSDFNDVKIIKQKGANLAPWNVGQYTLSLNQNNDICVNDDLLVFYHFASFKKISLNKYTTSISRYFSRPNNFLKEKIYRRYLNEVVYKMNLIVSQTSDLEMESLNKNRIQIHNNSIKKLFKEMFNNFRRWFYNDFIIYNELNQ